MLTSIRSKLSQAFKRPGDRLRIPHRESGAQLRQDVRYTLRSLRATPGFTLVAVLSLGFGIGSATTLFSAVDAVDLRPLPFPNQDRLVWLAEVTPEKHEFCSRCPSYTSGQTATDWFGQTSAFDAVGAIDETSFEWLRGDVTESAPAMRATPGLFHLLGVSPIVGRDFVAGDTLNGAEAVALLSYEVWQQRFSADPAIVGRRLRTAEADVTASATTGITIVGILPKDFRMVGGPAVWRPLRLGASKARSSRDVVAVARLKAGVSVQQASVELGTIAARMRAEHPKDYGGWDARAEPFRTYVKLYASKGRFVLFAITVLVLFTGVLNVTGLLLARASARRHEFALRSALGADRGRLMQQLLVEGATLGLAGGVAGGLFSVWGTKFVSGWLRIETTGLEVGIDARVLAFALTLALVVGIGASLLPALRASRTDLAMNFRVRGGRTHADARSNLVIVGQVALGLAVLTAATILSGEYLKLRYFDLGYDPRALYTTAVSATRDQRADDFARWRGIAEGARAQLAAIPGVQSASIEHLSAINPQIVRPEESAAYIATSTPPVKAVDPDYFRTWGTRLVAGRFFTKDDRLGDSPVVIVTDDAAAAFWPGGRAIGRRVFVGDSGAVGELLTVVGVVANAERGQLIARNKPILFRPFAQAKLYAPGITFALRATSGVPSVLVSAETELRKVTGRRVSPFRSELDRVRNRFVAQRLNAIALNFFGAFGLLLAAMGIYASVAYSVSLRLNEVALRMAFGAEAGSVLRLFARNSLIVVTKGVLLGIVGAVAIAKLLPTLTPNSSPASHALEYAVSVSVMILVTMVATYVPARRAVAVDPVEILRAD